MRAMRRGNLCSILAWFRWFLPSPIASPPGTTTVPFTRSATRSRDYSAALKVSAESSPAREKLDVLFLGFLNFALILENFARPTKRQFTLRASEAAVPVQIQNQHLKAPCRSDAVKIGILSKLPDEVAEHRFIVSVRLFQVSAT